MTTIIFFVVGFVFLFLGFGLFYRNARDNICTMCGSDEPADKFFNNLMISIIFYAVGVVGLIAGLISFFVSLIRD